MTNAEKISADREKVVARLWRFLRERPVLVIAVVAAAVVFIMGHYWSWLYYGNVCDDTLISLQYARNVASGNGLVFNIGEPVEGYTNFLWVVLLALLYPISQGLGLDFVHVAATVSILFSAANVILIYALGRWIWEGRALPTLFAIGTCIADNIYTVWAMQALESQFVIFWILLALWFSLTRVRFWPIWVGIALTCLVMTRPDAALFCVALVGHQLVLGVIDLTRGRSETGKLASLQPPFVTTGVFALVFGIYFVLRYSYFGYLLPNTYYLKVGGPGFDSSARGLDYLWSFLTERDFIPLIALLCVIWIRRPVIAPLFAWLLMHVAYVVYVGGDFYPGHRFFVVTVPVIGILCAQVIDGVTDQIERLFATRTGRSGSRLVRGVASAFAALLLIYASVIGLQRGPYEIEIKGWGAHIEATYRFMKWIGKNSPPDASIVVGDIGSAGYHAELHVYDIFGVIDPEIAHSPAQSLGKGKPGHEKRADMRRLIAKKPTYVKIGYGAGDLTRMGYFLNTRGPTLVGANGIWQRDDLITRGEYIEETDIHFGGEPPEGWEVSGEAFDHWDALHSRRGQQPVLGQTGSYLSSYHPTEGDNATGRVRSAPIELVGDLMVLSVGGGDDPERQRVSLIVDGERVFSVTGRNSEALGRWAWDISGLRGRTAVLEVVDAAAGGWGHIMVDEVRQWRPHPGGRAPEWFGAETPAL